MENIKEKVRKLLNLYERPGTEEEGANALAQAQRLMVKYHLEMNDVVITEEQVTNIVVDEFASNIPSWLSCMGKLIADNFRCHSIVVNDGSKWGGKNGRGLRRRATGRQLLFWGYETDINIALNAYQSAKIMAEHLLQEYRKTAYNFKSSRADFLAGFVDGIRAQLEKAKSESASMALVLTRPVEVEKAFDIAYPTRKAISVNQKRNVDNNAYGRGFNAGKNHRFGSGYLGS